MVQPSIGEDILMVTAAAKTSYQSNPVQCLTTTMRQNSLVVSPYANVVQNLRIFISIQPGAVFNHNNETEFFGGVPIGECRTEPAWCRNAHGAMPITSSNTMVMLLGERISSEDFNTVSCSFTVSFCRSRLCGVA